ncbi:MAG: hypothetical protein AB8G05_11680 [Oligoflexales bacterium]
MISEDFSRAVLFIDFKNPLFSKKRCDLLRMIPQKYTKDWKTVFLKSLEAHNSENVKALISLTKHPKSALQHINKEIKNYTKQINKQLETYKGSHLLIKQLFKLREDVFQNEISKNPLGQILEPGFRVIFPVLQNEMLEVNTRLYNG